MKQVQFFINGNLEYLQIAINDWLKKMHNDAKVATDGNVEFIVHDIKFISLPDCNMAMAIYSHQI